MPYSYTVIVAGGTSASFGVPFPYLEKLHVHVSVEGVEVPQSSLVWTSPGVVALPSMPTAAETVRIWRKTPVDQPEAVFTAGVFAHRDLNRVVLQILYSEQEAFDAAAEVSASLEAALTSIEGLSDAAVAAASEANSAKAAAIVAQGAAETAESVAEAAALSAATYAAQVAGAVMYANHAGVAAANIPSAVSAIYVAGRATPGDFGGGIMKRVASMPSHLGRVQSGDGQWWEIAEKVLTFEMFGAVADGTFGTNAHTVGTNNGTAIASAIACAAASNREIDLLGIYRTTAASMVLTAKVSIRSRFAGFGLVVPVYATDVGIWDKAGATLRDFTILVCTMEAKPANSGHLQACVLASDKGYFIGAANTDNGLSGFDYDGLTCWRRSVGGGGGSGIVLVGDASRGRIDNITDNGSPGGHTGLVLAHWAGQGNAYGSAVTKTWHTHDLEIGALRTTASKYALTLSSTFNITRTGTITQYGGLGVIVLLPGDEGDTLADPSRYPAGIIGKGHDLRGHIHWHNPATGAGKAVSIISQGTSPGPWRYMPLDPTVGFMSDLDWGVVCGDVTVYHATEANQGLLDVSYLRGNFSCGALRAVGSPVMDGAVSVAYSQAGYVTIGGIYGAYVRQALRIAAASNVKVLHSGYTLSASSTSSDIGLYVYGNTETGAVSGAHSAGATTLVLAAGITDRMSRNTPIKIGSNTVFTTSYNPPGVKNIPITPLPASVADGVAVTIDHRCVDHDVYLDGEGGYYGGNIARGAGVFRGSVRRAKIAGLYIRNEDIVNLDGMVFEGTGVDGASNTANDLNITNTLSLVKATGCTFGLNRGSGLAYNIKGNTDETTNVRFVGVGCNFVDYETDYWAGSSTTDRKFIGCTDKTGALIP